MYEDRRGRFQTKSDVWIKEQIYKWNWDSHLWGDKQLGGSITQRYCIWCGWIPPTECNISIAKICLENPEIKELKNRIDNAIKKVIELGFKKI